MKIKLVAAVLATAAVATAVAVPAIAARSHTAATTAKAPAATLVQRLEQRIDAAVQSGLLSTQQGAKLKQAVETGNAQALPFVQRVKTRLLGHAAAALGTTPKQLQTELDSGMTLRQILQAHGKSPDALVQRLVDRLDLVFGNAVGKGRLSQQNADTLIAKIQQKLAALLDHAFQPQG